MKQEIFEGRIIRGIAGFYYVYVDGIGVYECKAKGVFRNNNEKPLVGDMVRLHTVFDSEKDMTGSIEAILPRISALIRPAVANVDQAVVIFAAADPDPNLNLLDRFLCEMERQKVPSIICFNKADLIDENKMLELKTPYEKAGYQVMFVSAKRNELGELRELLAGKVSTVAGPSGAGKSSIVNLLQEQIHMETGTISKKLGRGRHTTRRAELIKIKELRDSFIVDTPGFSNISIMADEPLEVGALFPEISGCGGNCRFSGCAHIHEPDCSVKNAVEEGKIAKERYESYTSFFEEIKNRRKY